MTASIHSFVHLLKIFIGDLSTQYGDTHVHEIEKDPFIMELKVQMG